MATPADFTELDDAFRPTLQIPLNGKQYRVGAVDYETGLYFQRILALGVKAHQGQEISADDIELVSDEDEPDFLRRALGDTFDELVKDGISYNGLKFVASLVFTWTTQSFDAAKQLWDSRGKAPTPPQNRAERRTATRTRTGAGTTTRKPGSATTTSTRKGTAKAKAGQTSSPTGDS